MYKNERLCDCGHDFSEHHEGTGVCAKCNEARNEFEEYVLRRKEAWIHFLEASINAPRPATLRGRVQIVIDEMKTFRHDFMLEQSLAKREQDK